MTSAAELEEISVYFFSSLLVVIFGIVIYKTKKGSNYKFCIRVAWWLLISNLFSIMYTLAIYLIYNIGGLYEFLAVTVGFSAFMRDACFTQGHWVFAREYFQLGRRMPYILDRK